MQSIQTIQTTAPSKTPETQTRKVRAVLHPAEALTIPGKTQLHITVVSENVLAIIHGDRLITVHHRKDKLFEVKTTFDADTQPQCRRAMSGFGNNPPLVSIGQGDSRRDYYEDADGNLMPKEVPPFVFAR